ncbi:acetate non-utilizing protein 9 [Trichodelitschia bisporula]|uniref:Succinate dehydrogenase assembly factor 3 n=1 Tax=Trichodelitschia bisporula TaxID=703511 RepID=A0A6G1HVM2_9PEZI|nr:acetate non-utilizing protein 9 [Trichodelitschia bisporula]
MKPSSRLLATASSVITNNPNRAQPQALLPPLHLYRRVLRAQRKLPRDLRVLGDTFIKQEFRQHKDVENPLQLVGFLSSWQLFAQNLEGDTWRAGKLDKAIFEKMSDDQKVQLYELMLAARKGDADESQ